jgi:drug/metabolite transporter (DMT)-like permease
MQRGVVYGVLAGAIWGFIFLAPRLLPDFSPLLLSGGRYVMYGLVSLALAIPSARGLWSRLTRSDVIALVKQALVGNLLYYVLIATAVQMVGVGPSSLIVGILPVTVTLAGRRDHGAIDVKRLFWPLAMVMAGIVCINIDVFRDAGGHSASVLARLGGLACAAGALASWTWYAVDNSRYLRTHSHFNGNEWSVLWGIVTGLLGGIVWIVVLVLPAGTIQANVAVARWHMFWLVCLALAAAGSWLGNTLWNAASRRLPITLSGQMIVFETLFALIYGFAYDQRWPRPLEIAAGVLLLAGVGWSMRLHAAEQPAEVAAAATPP